MDYEARTVLFKFRLAGVKAKGSFSLKTLGRFQSGQIWQTSLNLTLFSDISAIHSLLVIKSST